jgi:ATP-dependent DNA helicase RecQ
VVRNCIKFLEKEGYLMLTDSYYRPAQLHITLNHRDIYRFQIEHPEYDAFIKLVLRSYEGVFNGYVNINETELARRSALPESNIHSILQQLDKREVISFIPETDKPQLVFLSDTVKPEHLKISKQFYHELKKRAVSRMDNAIHYATSGHKCRSQLLLAYFGETETTRCGICDVCIERNKLELSDLEFKTISDQIKVMLRRESMPLNIVIAHINEMPEDKIMKTIKWLLDNDKLEYFEGNKLKWK